MLYFVKTHWTRIASYWSWKGQGAACFLWEMEEIRNRWPGRLYRRDLEKIDNIEENVQTCNIEKVLQLKRKHCTVLFYAFDCDMFLNIWILNGEDRIRQKTILLEKVFVFSYLREILQHFSVDLNRDSKPWFLCQPSYAKDSRKIIW